MLGTSYFISLEAFVFAGTKGSLVVLALTQSFLILIKKWSEDLKLD